MNIGYFEILQNKELKNKQKSKVCKADFPKWLGISLNALVICALLWDDGANRSGGSYYSFFVHISGPLANNPFNILFPHEKCPNEIV